MGSEMCIRDSCYIDEEQDHQPYLDGQKTRQRKVVTQMVPEVGSRAARSEEVDELFGQPHDENA